MSNPQFLFLGASSLSFRGGEGRRSSRNARFRALRRAIVVAKERRTIVVLFHMTTSSCEHLSSNLFCNLPDLLIFRPKAMGLLKSCQGNSSCCFNNKTTSDGSVLKRLENRG